MLCVIAKLVNQLKENFKKIIVPEEAEIFFIIFYLIFFWDIFPFPRKLKIFCALYKGEMAGEGNVSERVGL